MVCPASTPGKGVIFHLPLGGCTQTPGLAVGKEVAR